MGETKVQKDKNKIKGDAKKKPTMKDILAKKKAGGGKAKKKWSRTKSKEKVNNSVFWVKATWDRCSKDLIAKEAYLTPSVISDKLKINVSLARAAIKQLLEEGKVVAYNGQDHSKFGVYVKSDSFRKEMEAKPTTTTADAKKDKKGGKK